MSFSLPDLPYAYDALGPYMSRETSEYHHDKHHLAYVNNGNNALKGTEWEGKSLEEIVKGSFGKSCRSEHIGLPPLSSGGALVARPWLRLHTPLLAERSPTP